jgi:hypothetical protein
MSRSIRGVADYAAGSQPIFDISSMHLSRLMLSIQYNLEVRSCLAVAVATKSSPQVFPRVPPQHHLNKSKPLMMRPPRRFMPKKKTSGPKSEVVAVSADRCGKAAQLAASHASDTFHYRPDSLARRPKSRINWRAADSMSSFGNTLQYLSTHSIIS